MSKASATGSRGGNQDVLVQYGSQHENTGGRSRNHENVQRDINDAMASGGTSDYLRYTGNVDFLMQTIVVACGLSIKKWKKRTRKTVRRLLQQFK